MTPYVLTSVSLTKCRIMLSGSQERAASGSKFPASTNGLGGVQATRPFFSHGVRRRQLARTRFSYGGSSGAPPTRACPVPAAAYAIPSRLRPSNLKRPAPQTAQKSKGSVCPGNRRVRLCPIIRPHQVIQLQRTVPSDAQSGTRRRGGPGRVRAPASEQDELRRKREQLLPRRRGRGQARNSTAERH